MDSTKTAGAASRPRGDRRRTPPRPASFGCTVRAYVALTKPRIIELLLVTTVPVMILAQGGLPTSGWSLATLVGGTARAGSAARVQLLPRPRHRRAHAPHR